MQVHKPSLPAREDTILGVCEALGEDFGFHPNFLRIALAGLLFWNPAVTIGGYLAAGLVIATIRWFVPNRRPAAATPGQVEASEPATVQAANMDEDLAVAA